MIRVVILTGFKADRTISISSLTPLGCIAIIICTTSYIQTIIAGMNTTRSIAYLKAVVINFVDVGNEEPHTIVGIIFKACNVRYLSSRFASFEINSSSER